MSIPVQRPTHSGVRATSSRIANKRSVGALTTIVRTYWGMDQLSLTSTGYVHFANSPNRPASLITVYVRSPAAPAHTAVSTVSEPSVDAPSVVPTTHQNDERKPTPRTPPIQAAQTATTPGRAGYGRRPTTSRKPPTMTRKAYKLIAEMVKTKPASAGEYRSSTTCGIA